MKTLGENTVKYNVAWKNTLLFQLMPELLILK